MTDLHRLSAVDLQGLLQAGEVSSEELTGVFLDRIDQVEPTLNSFLHVNQQARETARAIDQRRAAGETLPVR